MISKILISLKNSIYISVKRFPISIAFAAALTSVLIYISETEMYLNHSVMENLTRLAMILALGIPMSLCIKLAFEKQPISGLTKVLAAYAGMSALLVLYYLFLLKDLNMVSITRYIAFSAALYLCFIFIPYMLDRNYFEIYVIKLFSRVFITAIFSAILFAGLAALFFTIDKLLGVPIRDRLYLHTWFAVAGLFAPVHFFAGIPQQSKDFNTEDYPKVFKILLLYIVMPLIAAYTTILYIYFIKLLISLYLPNGLVGHLVLWYAVISTGVIFLVRPAVTFNKWARIFSFWLPKLIIPSLIVMFISLSVRINAYGITENRYFVFLLGIWVFGVMIYLNLVRNSKSILLPVSLALVAVLSVSGPWSSYSISRYSQNNRFEKLLIENNMLKDDRIVQAPAGISEEDKHEISQILNYFDKSHDFKNLKYVPEDFKLTDMKNIFGFEMYYAYKYPETNKFFSYYSNTAYERLDIRDYDYMFETRSYKHYKDREIYNPGIEYNNDTTEFKIIYEGREVYKRTLSDFALIIYEKFGINHTNEISIEDMTFTDANQLVKVKFVFTNVSGEKTESTGKIKLHSADFIVMLKIMD